MSRTYVCHTYTCVRAAAAGEIKFARIDRASRVSRPFLARSVGSRGARVVRIPSRWRGGAPLTLESRVGALALTRPSDQRRDPFLPSSVLGNRARLQPAGRLSIRGALFLTQRLTVNCDGMTCYFVNLSGSYEVFLSIPRP